jgi:hypothetical protein
MVRPWIVRHADTFFFEKFAGGTRVTDVIAEV